MQHYMHYATKISGFWKKGLKQAREENDQHVLPSLEKTDNFIKESLVPSLREALPDVDEETITHEAHALLFAYAFYMDTLSMKMKGQRFPKYVEHLKAMTGCEFPAVDEQVHMPFKMAGKTLSNRGFGTIPPQHIPRIIVSFYDAIHHMVVIPFQKGLETVPQEHRDNFERFVTELRGIVARKREYALKLCTLSCLSPELLAIFHFACKAKDVTHRDQLAEELTKVHSARADQLKHDETEKTCIARFVLNEFKRVDREATSNRFDTFVVVLYRLAQILSSNRSEAEKQLKEECIKAYRDNQIPGLVLSGQVCKESFTTLLERAIAPVEFNQILSSHSEKIVGSIEACMKAFYGRNPPPIFVGEHRCKPPLKAVDVNNTTFDRFLNLEDEIFRGEAEVDRLRKIMQCIEDTESDEYKTALEKMLDKERLVEELRAQSVVKERDLRGIVLKRSNKRPRAPLPGGGDDDQEGPAGPRRRIEPDQGSAAAPPAPAPVAPAPVAPAPVAPALVAPAPVAPAPRAKAASAKKTTASKAGNKTGRLVIDFKTSLTVEDPIFERFTTKELKDTALKSTLQCLTSIEKIQQNADKTVNAIGNLRQAFRPGDGARATLWSFYCEILSGIDSDDVSDEVRELVHGKGNFTALIAAFALFDPDPNSKLRMQADSIQVTDITTFVVNRLNGWNLKEITVEKINAMRPLVRGVGYPPVAE